MTSRSPEAVATRNNAEALRLIALGSDPNSPSRVRDGLLTNGATTSSSRRSKPPSARRVPIRFECSWQWVHESTNVSGWYCAATNAPGMIRACREILDAGASGEPDCAHVRLPVDRKD